MDAVRRRMCLRTNGITATYPAHDVVGAGIDDPEHGRNHFGGDAEYNIKVPSKVSDAYHGTFRHIGYGLKESLINKIHDGLDQQHGSKQENDHQGRANQYGQDEHIARRAATCQYRVPRGACVLSPNRGSNDGFNK